MPQTSIIITNWNGKKWLDGCFRALAEQTYTDFEIILVDDGSTDGSATWVAKHHPDVHLIRQETHLGFSGANNVGIRAARGEYIVTLNNDTCPEPNWLAEMIDGLSESDVGMIASQTLVWQEPDRIDSAGIEVDWAGLAWNRYWRQPAQNGNVAEEVFGPCAAAALYRKQMLDQIGLFDEDFYTYYEDVDLAWRARRAGWRCQYRPTAKLLHHHSATGGQGSPRKVFLLSRNKIWAIAKNYGWRDLLWRWPFILAYDVASAVFHMARLRSFIPLQGRFAALVGLPKIIRKRVAPRAAVKLIPPPTMLP